jgi:hypothetical protein
MQTNVNFWNVQFGPDDAKGDDLLKSYFVKIPEYEKLIAGDKRYVIGRKGTGKTAVCEYIKQQCEENSMWFCKHLSLRNFPLSDIRELEDRSYRDKSKFVPAWYFLILVEIASMISDDNGAGSFDDVIEIREFIEMNFPSKTGFVDTISQLKANKSKVRIMLSWLEGSDEDSTSTQQNITVHYQKACEILEEKIRKVSSSSMYFIFLDELDEGYRAGDTSLRLLLLALLRAVENLSLSFTQSHLNVRPVLALRSDIFDNLEDNDLNKLDDYIIRLQWLAIGKHSYSLKDIIEHRIAASFDGSPIQYHWRTIAKENDRNIPRAAGDSLWKYMNNRTFERPRDIIKFLKFCQDIKGQGLLDFNTVSHAERNYSDWFYREIKDEINSHLPVWKEAMNCISRVGTARIRSSDVLIEKFVAEPKIKRWMEDNRKEPIEILELLFEFSVIGNINNNGHWIFKYKNSDITFNQDASIIIQFGLVKKLALKL